MDAGVPAPGNKRRHSYGDYGQCKSCPEKTDDEFFDQPDDLFLGEPQEYEKIENQYELQAIEQMDKPHLQHGLHPGYQQNRQQEFLPSPSPPQAPSNMQTNTQYQEFLPQLNPYEPPTKRARRDPKHFFEEVALLPNSPRSRRPSVDMEDLESTNQRSLFPESFIHQFDIDPDYSYPSTTSFAPTFFSSSAPMPPMPALDRRPPHTFIKFV